MPVPGHTPGDTVLRLWQSLAATERLPPQWLADTVRHVTPLAVSVAVLHANRQQPLVVGINGAQGTGKSTLANALALMLDTTFHLQTTILSLDNFYLSHAARRRLGQTVHPLLVIRAVPGTHDVSLALDTLQQLQHSSDDIVLPGFDKAHDDCIAAGDRGHTRAPRDIVIAEGWCIGVSPQTDAALAAGLSNQQQARSRLMTPDAISRFMQHYERLTRHCLATLPAQADAVLRLDTDHRIHHSEAERP